MSNPVVKPVYLTDHWTHEDALNFFHFRPALETILKTAETPLTVGIFGPWGSGKTSLMRMMRKEIDKDPSLRSVWFTAWKYDRHEALWRAFILRVLDALYPRETEPKDQPREERPILAADKQSERQQKLVRLLNQLEESIYQDVEWEEIGKRSLKLGQLLSSTGKAGAEITATIATGGLYSTIKNMVGGDESPVDDVKKAAEAISHETKKRQRRQLFYMEQFEETFQEAIKQLSDGGNGRLIIFVDDLDRCLPEKAIEVLEAIKLFLEVPGTVFVLGMDQRVIQRGINARYGALFRQQLEDGGEMPISGDAYLQKLVQIPFHLPAMAVEGLEEFVASQDKQLSPMTRQVFARGLYPNPRQVKRALNIFRLLQQIALEREKQKVLEPGMIAWPLLAKTVIIQTQYPELYQQWRQYPTLLQTLEEEYTSRPTSEDELFRGRTRQETAGEDGTEKSTQATESKSGGLMEPYLRDRFKYALLARLLTFPPTEKDGEGVNKARFAGLGRAHMAAYMRLAGAVETTETVPVEVPGNLLAELLSGDLAKIQDAAARLDEQEKKIDGPQHEGVRQSLLATLTSGEAAPVRISAGYALGLVGDPRKEILTLDEIPFCYVPAGPFWMGSSEEEDEKEHLNASLDYDFWLAQHPVTNAQYDLFVKAGGYAQASLWSEAKEASHWKDGKYGDRERPFDLGSPFTLPNHPVVGISWYEALAFVRWLNAQIKSKLPAGLAIQLPSEAEWEKAARGGTQIPDKPHIVTNLEVAQVNLIKNSEEKRRYPWGEKLDGNIAHHKETGIETTSAVGTFPHNLSPYGVTGLSGNTYEWTRSKYKPYEYQPVDGRETLDASNDIRVLKGGYYGDDERWLRCASRSWASPDLDRWLLGMRLVVSPFTADR